MRRQWLVLPVSGLGAAFGTFGDVGWARTGAGWSCGSIPPSLSRMGRSHGVPRAPRRDFGTIALRPEPAPQTPAPGTPTFGGGVFLRSLGGGIVAGFPGNLLFSSRGWADTGPSGFGGSGFGFLELLLLAGGAYLLYTVLTRRREQHAMAGAHAGHGGFGVGSSGGGGSPAVEPTPTAHAQQEHVLLRMSSEEELRDVAKDILYRVQSAWASGDLTWAQGVMTPQIYEGMAAELRELRRQGHINRLENTVLRRVEIGEAWQEAGRECFQAQLTAAMLDYVVDESTGEVVAGSRTEPTRFTENWTFVRDPGGMWRVAGIGLV